MADFTVRDPSGNLIGRISESPAPGCIGCLGLSLVTCIIYGAVNIYQYVQARRALNSIEAQRVVVPNNVLDSFTGEYDYGRYRIKIERRGDRLYNKSDEEFCELVPVSTQEFIYKSCVNGFQGRGRFVKDERGKLALIIIHRDGRSEKATRVN